MFKISCQHEDKHRLKPVFELPKVRKHVNEKCFITQSNNCCVPRSETSPSAQPVLFSHFVNTTILKHIPVNLLLRFYPKITIPYILCPDGFQSFYRCAAHSESPETSFKEGNTNQREDKTNASELSGLKKRARCTAELEHRAEKEGKIRKAHHRPGKISKSRKQESNIRSAEICRKAKKKYVELLEETIQLKEEEYRRMSAMALDQIIAKTQLQHKVMRLEEMCRRKDAQESWMQLHRVGNNWEHFCHVGNTVPDEVVDQFFPVSERAQLEWDHRKEELNASNGNIEMCNWNEVEWMDFEEVYAPMTAARSPAVKLDTPVTPKKEKQRGRNCNVDKLLLSPTTIVQGEQEGEEGFSGLRL